MPMKIEMLYIPPFLYFCVPFLIPDCIFSSHQFAVRLSLPFARGKGIIIEYPIFYNNINEYISKTHGFSRTLISNVDSRYNSLLKILFSLPFLELVMFSISFSSAVGKPLRASKRIEKVRREYNLFSFSL